MENTTLYTGRSNYHKELGMRSTVLLVESIFCGFEQVGLRLAQTTCHKCLQAH